MFARNNLSTGDIFFKYYELFFFIRNVPQNRFNHHLAVINVTESFSRFSVLEKLALDGILFYLLFPGQLQWRKRVWWDNINVNQ